MNLEFFTRREDDFEVLEEKSTGRKPNKTTHSRSGDSVSPTPYDDETPSPSPPPIAADDDDNPSPNPPPITSDEDDGEPGMPEMAIWHAVGLYGH